MSRYFAVLFSDLERHSVEWSRVPRERMVSAVAEYRYLAESLSSQYGCHYREWAGDGHMFLFESADAAVRFGLKLLESWRIASDELAALRDVPRLGLRLGCHFGECTPLGGGGAWIGRGNAIAKRVESEAEPGSMLVSEVVLDLLDLPLYEYAPVGERSLRGDHLEKRRLYGVLAFSQELLEEKPRDELSADDWFLRGAGLIGTVGEWSQEEADCYLEALRLRPAFAEAHNNLAAVLRALGRFGEATRHYQEALRVRPDYPEAHYNYAALLAGRGSTGGAEEHYRQALALRPDYVDAHHGFANLLKERGERAAAEHQYREALRFRPDYPEVHNNLAILLEEGGDAEGARHHYSEALRLRSQYAEAHYNFALFLEGRGEVAGAEGHYREALRLRVDYPEAQNNLAVLLQLQGRFAEAEHHYVGALGARPDDPETHYNYALLLRARGETAEAERHLQLARELAPDEERFRTTVRR